MLCPVCTAALDLQTDCRRCGLKTATIRDAQRAAQRLLRASMQALGAGHLEAAERYLHTAQRLHRCPESADLAWLLALYRSQSHSASPVRPAARPSVVGRIGRALTKWTRHPTSRAP